MRLQTRASCGSRARGLDSARAGRRSSTPRARPRRFQPESCRACALRCGRVRLRGRLHVKALTRFGVAIPGLTHTPKLSPGVVERPSRLREPGSPDTRPLRTTAGVFASDVHDLSRRRGVGSNRPIAPQHPDLPITETQPLSPCMVDVAQTSPSSERCRCGSAPGAWSVARGSGVGGGLRSAVSGAGLGELVGSVEAACPS